MDLCNLVQEKIEILNERLDQLTSGGTATGKDEGGDTVDGMQAWKQSVKKCDNIFILNIEFYEQW